MNKKIQFRCAALLLIVSCSVVVILEIWGLYKIDSQKLIELSKPATYIASSTKSTSPVLPVVPNKIIKDKKTIPPIVLEKPGIIIGTDITKENVLNGVNENRYSNGVTILKENKQLDLAAEEKLNDMVTQNYFAHVSPLGKTAFNFIQGVNYGYKYAGENLAEGNWTVQEMIDGKDGWMLSPTHRANILNNNYIETGIAIGQGIYQGQNVTLVVQLFTSPLK